MKYNSLILSLLFSANFIIPLSAQVTIGSDIPPNKGVLLDLKENDNVGSNANSGVVFPRVKLTNLSKLYPMMESTPESGTPDTDYDTAEKKATEDAKHQGMIVYNLNIQPDCGFVEGLYLWNGNSWNPVTPDPSIGKGSYASDVAALKAFYNANPGNTLGWDLENGDPTTFKGATWLPNTCGESRLTFLEVPSTGLTSDVGLDKLSELSVLNIRNNSFRTLDFSKNTKLSVVYCQDNNLLVSLNLAGCASLTQLNCQGSKLTSLDLTQNTNLVTLDCSGNMLNSLTFGNNKLEHLVMFTCKNNVLTQTALDALSSSNKICTAISSGSKSFVFLPQTGANPATNPPQGCGTK